MYRNLKKILAPREVELASLPEKIREKAEKAFPCGDMSPFDVSKHVGQHETRPRAGAVPTARPPRPLRRSASGTSDRHESGRRPRSGRPLAPGRCGNEDGAIDAVLHLPDG